MKGKPGKTFSVNALSQRLLIIFLAYGYALIALAEPDTNQAVTPELPKRHGFLLLRLDVDGTAPSIEYGKAGVLNTPSRQGKINLKDVEKEFLLLPLKRGDYQITHVNVPFFDLPYVLDTSDDERWHFRIQEGKVNYLGLLEISKERTSEHVNIKLLNRFATDMDVLREKYREILKIYPLTPGAGYRDDFYMEYTKE